MAAVHYTIKDANSVDQDFASYGGDNNALLTTIDAKLALLNGYVDGLEALIGTSNNKSDVLATKLDSVFGAVDGLESALSTLNAAVADTTTDSPVSSHTPVDVIPFVPLLDTAAYAAGDVLSATAVLSNVMRVNDGRANIFSLTGVDKTKQKPAMTMLFYQTNVSSAAANAPNALSDADQLNLLGFQRIAASDWIDYANNSICGFKGPTSPGILLEAATGTKDVYIVCILDAGTPTFAVNDLMFKIGVVQA